MADRKITDFLTLTTLKTNTIFTVVDPDEGAPADQNKKITTASMFSTFEPTFSKNTAFNKNFGGSGAATTVARSDHAHNYSAFTGLSDTPSAYTGAANKLVGVNSTPDGLVFITPALDINTDVEFSAKVAGDLLYYNGSLWTNLPFGQVQSIYNYWTETGSDLSYPEGNVTVDNALLLPGAVADVGFATSKLLSLDSSNAVDTIAASGGGTTNFLRADGTWAAPPGGGGSPGGVTNEIQKNDGIGGFAGAGSFSSSGGDLVLGTGLSGSSRTIQATGSATPVDLHITPTGIASNLYLSHGTTSGLVYIGESGDTGTERRLSVAGSQSNINLVISAKGTGWVTTTAPFVLKGYAAGSLPTVSSYDQGLVYVTDEDLLAVSNNTSWLRVGIAPGGLLTDLATVDFNCDSNQQYVAHVITTQSSAVTLSVSNFGLIAQVIIHKTSTNTITLTITGTGYKFINMSSLPKVAATSSINLSLDSSSVASIPFEVSLIDSGETSGGDIVLLAVLR